MGSDPSTSALAAEPNAAPAAPTVPVTVAASLPSIVTLAAGPAAIGYKASPDARYCFRTEVTGSRIARKLCKTRSAWEATGVNLDEALAGR